MLLCRLKSSNFLFLPAAWREAFFSLRLLAASGSTMTCMREAWTQIRDCSSAYVSLTYDQSAHAWRCLKGVVTL